MANSDDRLVHTLGGSSTEGKFTIQTFLIIIILAAALGGAGGFFMSSFSPQVTSQVKDQSSGETASKKSAGVLDEKKFPDKVEGLLKEGGVEGEGSFHLERPGGESQNVYLTSSIVDLSLYVGKKVRVRGETQKAQKAGWLMDVGYVEIL